VLTDAGVENVNAQVDELIHTGVLRRVLAFTELKSSNSMIEAWWPHWWRRDRLGENSSIKVA